MCMEAHTLINLPNKTDFHRICEKLKINRNDEDNNNMIIFSWDIHWTCNYDCPYCWWHNNWTELALQNYYPGTEKLVETWERIYKMCGRVKLNLLGGEPLIYPDIASILDKIVELHEVEMTTNLSIGAGDLEKIKSLNKITIGATFHPSFTSLSEFVDKVIYLKNKETNVSVIYLAYPSQIEFIPEYRAT